MIWDNLHANDYDQSRLLLGPYIGHFHLLDISTLESKCKKKCRARGWTEKVPGRCDDQPKLRVQPQHSSNSEVKYWIEGTFYWPKNSKKCTEYIIYFLLCLKLTFYFMSYPLLEFHGTYIQYTFYYFSVNKKYPLFSILYQWWGMSAGGSNGTYMHIIKWRNW